MSIKRLGLLIGWLLMAVVPLVAQTDSPLITEFTATQTTVSRSALANRTARIPVSWDTVNRPLSANLVFEQVLFDGSRVNVELPRLIPWVASAGDGIVAPILDGPDAYQVVLRVTLYNIFDGTVYSSREILIPIREDGGGDGGDNALPTLRSFTTSETSVSLTALRAGIARVPVRWAAVNRPITANLVFEQLLDDGSIINVELPRNNPWVNSVERGVVAPQPPQTRQDIRLRVRLIDLLFGKTYDQRYLTIPVVDDTDIAPPTPEITQFGTVTQSISWQALQTRTVRMDVFWSVVNRPANTNLVFEQVLANGSVRNAELPRDFVVVPSSGVGIVTLIPPAGNTVVDRVTVQVRLVSMMTGRTLTSRQLTMPIVNQPSVPDDGDDTNGSGDDDSDTGGLQIESFTVTPTRADAGERVTFTWQIDGTFDRANIRWDALPSSDVAAITSNSGSVSVTIPDSLAGQHTAILTVRGDSTQTATVVVDIGCEPDWQIVTGERICPASVALVATGAYQTFERGFMIWHPGQTMSMWTFFNDGRVVRRVDSWGGDAYTIDGTPPSGLRAPERGFGYLWSTTPSIREGLGWATAPEQSYEVRLQTTRVDADFIRRHYLTTPDGRVIKVTETPNGTLTWERV